MRVMSIGATSPSLVSAPRAEKSKGGLGFNPTLLLHEFHHLFGGGKGFLVLL